MKLSRFSPSIFATLFSFAILFASIGQLQAATITVTGTGDIIAADGLVTLREAITSINGAADINADVTANRTGNYGTNDTINFTIGGGGVQTIQPTSALPDITNPVVIDGYTQPESSPNTNGPGLGSDAHLLIELDGSNLPNTDGLTITAGSSTVKGLIINRFGTGGIFGSGISLETNGGNTVEGNFIGTNFDGTASLENVTRGVFITSDGNTIGGTVPSARNLISGNGERGIFILGGDNNIVQGNLIGTDISGTVGLGNGSEGVHIANAVDNQVGGTTPEAGNVISANGSAGVEIFSNTATAATGNVVQGNLIGTDVTGALDLGNAGDGIIFGGLIVADNTVGGTASGAGNRIAFNDGNGVNVSQGSGMVIWGNSIYSNAGLGIDLAPVGVTANDAGDGDTGSNNLQNFPDLTSAVSANGSTTIQGTLNSTAGANFRIEFFVSDACDDSGNGEGQTLLGSADATTDGSGNATLNTNLPIALAGTKFITVTATDTTTSDTSEFSKCLQATILLENCTNATDDDGDNAVDCDDVDCAADPACAPLVEDCDNTVDDDGDGLTDCTDPDCAGNPACDLEVSGSGCGMSESGSRGVPFIILLLLAPLGALFLKRRFS